LRTNSPPPSVAACDRPAARGFALRSAHLVYGAYTLTLLAVLIVVAALLAFLLPFLSWRRSVTRSLARFWLWASALRVRVDGLPMLPAGSCVLVANHASYLDGIVLLAVAPERCAFVAKGELSRNFPARLLLGNIGTRFVERFAIEDSVEAARELVTQAEHGMSFVFFPEGTLRREPGLRPFHLGAFQAAVAAGMPAIPVAVRGTRSVLRDGQWRPRRGVIQVIVTPPLAPDGGDWAAAVRLRDRARAAILAACGEPDLAGRAGGQA
jgi:1-acyl-sn-glycerol-3-phosphate acyltransferase